MKHFRDALAFLIAYAASVLLRFVAATTPYRSDRDLARLRHWAFSSARWMLGEIGVPLVSGGADETEAAIGAGATLSYWNTVVSPPAWAVLGPVRNLQGVGQTNPEVNSTTLDSTSEEYLAGLPNGETFSCVVTTNPTNKPLIRGWIQAKTPIDFKLQYNDDLFDSGDDDYFTVTPLHFDGGQIQPSGLMETTFSGRISGDISSTPSHP